jgi:hypothetical protein
MDYKLLVVLIGVASGVIGYWFTTFSMQPILRYRNIRSQIMEDFIYYAQVVNADDLNKEMQDLHRQRILANRKTSSQLSAILLELPWWYLAYLKLLGQSPKQAATRLIGFSNTFEYEQSAKVQASIRKNLGLPSET